MDASPLLLRTAESAPRPTSTAADSRVNAVVTTASRATSELLPSPVGSDSAVNVTISQNQETAVVAEALRELLAEIELLPFEILDSLVMDAKAENEDYENSAVKKDASSAKLSDEEKQRSGDDIITARDPRTSRVSTEKELPRRSQENSAASSAPDHPNSAQESLLSPTWQSARATTGGSGNTSNQGGRELAIFIRDSGAPSTGIHPPESDLMLESSASARPPTNVEGEAHANPPPSTSTVSSPANTTTQVTNGSDSELTPDALLTQRESQTTVNEQTSDRRQVGRGLEAGSREVSGRESDILKLVRTLLRTILDGDDTRSIFPGDSTLHQFAAELPDSTRSALQALVERSFSTSDGTVKTGQGGGRFLPLSTVASTEDPDAALTTHVEGKSRDLISNERSSRPESRPSAVGVSFGNSSELLGRLRDTTDGFAQATAGHAADLRAAGANILLTASHRSGLLQAVNVALDPALMFALHRALRNNSYSPKVQKRSSSKILKPGDLRGSNELTGESDKDSFTHESTGLSLLFAYLGSRSTLRAPTLR